MNRHHGPAGTGAGHSRLVRGLIGDRVGSDTFGAGTHRCHPVVSPKPSSRLMPRHLVQVRSVPFELRTHGRPCTGRGYVDGRWILRQEFKQKMGVETEKPVTVGDVTSGQKKFLDFHRNSVLLMAVR